MELITGRDQGKNMYQGPGIRPNVIPELTAVPVPGVDCGWEGGSSTRKGRLGSQAGAGGQGTATKRRSPHPQRPGKHSVALKQE